MFPDGTFMRFTLNLLLVIAPTCMYGVAERAISCHGIQQNRINQSKAATGYINSVSSPVLIKASKMF